MNAPTQHILRNALDQWMFIDGDMPNKTATSMRDYYQDQLHDFSDSYDAEWMALIATKAIEAIIDWDLIAQKVNELIEAMKE